MKMTSMARMGSAGNNKLLSKYGGHAKTKKYADGGRISAPGAPRKAYADGGPIDGMPARARLDRPGKKGGKSKKGGKTTVNVVVAGKGGGDAPPAAPPMPMPPPGAGPGGPPPPMGPPPMRKDGGRIANLGKYAHGGRVYDAGAGSGEGRLEKKDQYANGGSVKKKADGGPAIAGDPEDRRATADRSDRIRSLQKKVDDEPASLGNPSALKLGAGAATAMHFLGRSKLSAPVRGIAGALGLGAAASGAKGLANDFGKMNDAIDAKRELRQTEGRKNGGRAK